MKSKTGIAIASVLCLLTGGTVWANVPATITTTDGQTYNNVSLIRTEPDGYLVSYDVGQNSLGMAKIKFSRLSSDMQKEAGYDTAKASEFEKGIAQANENLRQEVLQWEKSAKAEREARQVREDQQDELAFQRLSVLAQLETARAMAARSGNDNYSGAYLGGYGAGLIAVPQEGFGFGRNGFGLSTGFFPFALNGVGLPLISEHRFAPALRAGLSAGKGAR